jgi:thioredoxin-like negative regulator of GroEL
MRELLYFSTSWCQPCKTLAPIMAQASQQIPVQKLDAETNREQTSRYDVRNVPTVILVEDGQEIKRFTGIRPLDQVLSFYNS